jgi:cytoskeletal protein RodZ
MELIGARLKKIRLEKGLSLEDVHKGTKIHLNILKAIEGDSITDLNPIYLKSFLKLYCNFLGLDPKGYSQDVKETKTYIHTDTARRNISPPTVKPKEFVKQPPVNLRPFRQDVKLIKLAFIILASLLLITGLFKLVKAKHKQPVLKTKAAVIKKQAKSVKSAASVKTAAPITKSASKASAPKESGAPVQPRKEIFSGIRLVIKAKDNCWINLISDGKVVFRRVLEKGRSQTWEAKEKIEFSLGNAGGVEIEVNEQHFTNLGRRGQSLKNIVVTKEGLKIER